MEDDPLSHIFNRELSDPDNVCTLELYFDDLPVFEREMGENRKEAHKEEVHTFLKRKCLRIYDFLMPNLTAFLWHGDAFHLQVMDTETKAAVQKETKRPKRTEEETETVPHLCCSLRVGEGVCDEWFLFFLTSRLTSTFPEITARLRDGDGEFLLIEAAHCIPSWLEPSTSENRIFIKEGSLRILLPTFPRPSPSPERPLLLSSLSYLRRDAQGRSIAKAAVQRLLQKRVGGFPKKAIQESSHRVNVVVPESVAALLHVFPHFVSVALNNLPPPSAAAIKAAAGRRKSLSSAGVGSLHSASPFSFSPLPSSPAEPQGGENKTNPTSSEVQQPPSVLRGERERAVLFPCRMTRLHYARLMNLHFRSPAEFSLTRWPFPEGVEKTEIERGRGREKGDGSAANPQLTLARSLGAKLCLGLHVGWGHMGSSAADAVDPGSLLWFDSSAEVFEGRGQGRGLRGVDIETECALEIVSGGGMEGEAHAETGRDRYGEILKEMKSKMQKQSDSSVGSEANSSPPSDVHFPSPSLPRLFVAEQLMREASGFSPSSDSQLSPPTVPFRPLLSLLLRRCTQLLQSFRARRRRRAVGSVAFPWEALEFDDDCGWMEVGEEELDRVCRERMQDQRGESGGDILLGERAQEKEAEEAPAEDKQKRQKKKEEVGCSSWVGPCPHDLSSSGSLPLSERISNFLNRESGFEGVERDFGIDVEGGGHEDRDGGVLGDSLSSSSSLSDGSEDSSEDEGSEEGGGEEREEERKIVAQLDKELREVAASAEVRLPPGPGGLGLGGGEDSVESLLTEEQKAAVRGSGGRRDPSLLSSGELDRLLCEDFKQGLVLESGGGRGSRQGAGALAEENGGGVSSAFLQQELSLPAGVPRGPVSALLTGLDGGGDAPSVSDGNAAIVQQEGGDIQTNQRRRRPPRALAGALALWNEKFGKGTEQA